MGVLIGPTNGDIYIGYFDKEGKTQGKGININQNGLVQF